MDLKPPSSGMSHRNRMENLAHLRRGDEVKIVIGDRVDYEWAATVIRDAGYPGNEVVTLFSPVQGRVAPAELSGWILSDRLPVRLNMQWHKIIWPDAERGV